MTIDSDRTLHHGGFVNGNRTDLRAAWRLIALLTLFAWLGALSICTAHCALGKNAPGHNNDAESPPSCHSGKAAQDSNSGSDSKSSGSFCFTMKSLFSGLSQVALHPPDAPALLQPVVAALNPADANSDQSTQVFRHARPPDFVFTPEVYLGPAFRSHAPPTV